MWGTKKKRGKGRRRNVRRDKIGRQMTMVRDEFILIL